MFFAEELGSRRNKLTHLKIPTQVLRLHVYRFYERFELATKRVTSETVSLDISNMSSHHYDKRRTKQRKDRGTTDNVIPSAHHLLPHCAGACKPSG